MIERLDDLNPIDVLHSGGTHILTCLNNSTVFFRVFLHLGHVTEHPDRYRNQGYQCHSPIQHKQVNNDGDGDKQVRSHFRDDMCQWDFHLLHALHHGRFQPTRRCIGQIAHGNMSQLVRHSPPRLRQHTESGLVRASSRNAVEDGLEQIGDQGYHSPNQINRKVLFSRNE